MKNLESSWLFYVIKTWRAKRITKNNYINIVVSLSPLIAQERQTNI